MCGWMMDGRLSGIEKTIVSYVLYSSSHNLNSMSIETPSNSFIWQETLDQPPTINNDDITI